MFAAAFHTSRHYILFTAMACLCVLLGGPSYAAGADSLFIAGSTFYESGVSGPGWTWTDKDHLELNGYTGEAIGAVGDLVVTLVGQNSVVETHAPDADISMSGMEVWGNLTLRGSGSLTATGSQCGIHVSQALVVDGCTVDARADGAGVLEQTVAGIAAGSLTVRGGGRVVAASAGPILACAFMACECSTRDLELTLRARRLLWMRPGWMRPVRMPALSAIADRSWPRTL